MSYFRAGFASLVGGRENNEDACLVATRTGSAAGDGHPAGVERLAETSPFDLVAVVADGMGGGSFGEVCSGIVISAVRDVFVQGRYHEWVRAQGLGAYDTSGVLREFARILNRTVLRQANRRGVDQMGTTMDMLVAAEGHYHWVHVGDSRIYSIEDAQRFSQITKDHNLAQFAASRGIASDMVKKGNLVTSMLGTNTTFTADVGQGVISPGQVFILCSDGLDRVGPNEYAAALQAEDFMDLAHGWATTAVRRKGPKADNATVVVIRQTDSREAAAAAGEALAPPLHSQELEESTREYSRRYLWAAEAEAAEELLPVGSSSVELDDFFDEEDAGRGRESVGLFNVLGQNKFLFSALLVGVGCLTVLFFATITAVLVWDGNSRPTPAEAEARVAETTERPVEGPDVPPQAQEVPLVPEDSGETEPEPAEPVPPAPGSLSAQADGSDFFAPGPSGVPTTSASDEPSATAQPPDPERLLDEVLAFLRGEAEADAPDDLGPLFAKADDSGAAPGLSRLQDALAGIPRPGEDARAWLVRGDDRAVSLRARLDRVETLRDMLPADAELPGYGEARGRFVEAVNTLIGQIRREVEGMDEALGNLPPPSLPGAAALRDRLRAAVDAGGGIPLPARATNHPPPVLLDTLVAANETGRELRAAYIDFFRNTAKAFALLSGDLDAYFGEVDATAVEGRAESADARAARERLLASARPLLGEARRADLEDLRDQEVRWTSVDNRHADSFFDDPPRMAESWKGLLDRWEVFLFYHRLFDHGAGEGAVPAFLQRDQRQMEKLRGADGLPDEVRAAADVYLDGVGALLRAPEPPAVDEAESEEESDQSVGPDQKSAATTINRWPRKSNHRRT